MIAVSDICVSRSSEFAQEEHQNKSKDYKTELQTLIE